MKRIQVSRSSLLLLLALPLCAQVHLIEGGRIRAHVKFLSSDLLEGRAPGTRGGELAESYIAAQFESAGLKPGGDEGTFFQKVPLRTVEVLPDAGLSVSSGGKSFDLKWLDEYVGTSTTQDPTAAFETEAVFVGHGIVAPEFGWNDYAQANVKDKVVVMFTNEPPSEDPKFFKGKALSYYGRWTYKYEEAARQGAAAALIIHTTPTASYGWQVLRANGRPQPQIRKEPGAPGLGFAGWVTQEAGERLLRLAGTDVEQALRDAGRRGFQAQTLRGVKIRGSFRFGLKDTFARNVIARAEGTSFREEALIFSAHHDHLGTGEPVNGDRIYNGAVDNATGCALLIEMARAWASMEPKPLRTAYFAAVTAEESGLLGAKYLAQHLPIPAGKVMANLNFDSFSHHGRVRDTVLTGADRTTLWPIVEAAADRHELRIKLDPRPEAGSYYRSDHFAFAQVGIPSFSVNMGNELIGRSPEYLAARSKEYGSRYHQPSDEYSDDWDFSGMEQFGRFGFALGLDIANAPKLATWREGDEFLAERVKSGVR
jgi:Zn-dependent M28 family amino/carboxypeptidase